jgi:hypothetical protein
MAAVHMPAMKSARTLSASTPWPKGGMIVGVNTKENVNAFSTCEGYCECVVTELITRQKIKDSG